ncbi:SDR family NAD(P)-dependent oxidoreductase [Bacillus ndiopicus]|uniref:SDR family NAD(P)-dependent oxidoreductase n=1 Tax=Bacillus ndiopicus TaxID=1347368 RepID=UPI0005A80A6D|nr:SDR family oxidoreductase [Bacillus ndiopicus]
MARLANKVAIITGAASGQGAEEARLFAREGAKVVATDVQFELLESVVKDINENGGEAIAVAHNVASADDWKKVVEAAVKEYGKVDILVNNAGITGLITQPIEEVEESTWDRILDINTKGPFLGIKAVLPEMKKVGGGSIVNISSLSGINGVGNAAYNSSKGGLRLLTKNVALDYGKYNIRVNSVHPGTIETPMIEMFTSNKEVREATMAGIPLNVLGQPSDIAYGVLYLASDESKFVTGIELIIDGGSILH